MIFAQAVAKNPNTPPNMLELLAGHSHVWVRRAAVGNPNCPARNVAEAVSAGWHERSGVAANPTVDADTLDALAGDADWVVRKTAAGNPNIASDTLTWLGEDEDKDVRAAAATNPNLPATVLAAAVTDPSLEVRAAVSANPTLPAAALAALAGDANWQVRASVSFNTNLPVNLLTALAGDGNTYVRRSAAANPNLPANVLAVTVGDDDEDVRAAVAFGMAARLAVPARLRPPEVADYAQVWLTGANPNGDPELRIAAIRTVTDAGLRTGHILAYGPDWETDLAAFRARYGDTYLPVPDPPTVQTHTRRRAPRDAQQAQSKL